MSEKKQLPGGAILFGLILIAIGGLVLLANMNILPFDLDLGHWWPLILVVLGVVHLWNNRNIFDFSGLFLILLGVVFLMATLGTICWSDIWRYWPAVLILLGISIIFKRHPVALPGFGRGGTPSSETSVSINNILSGSERRINSQEFKGGDISNILGGTKLDLLEAKLAPGDWLLTVSTVLGGVDIMVPRDWQIEVHPTNLLGGIDDHTRQTPQAGGGKLVIKASALLGGIDIKN
ncbi:MAG: cell wall-active antibiotics response protein [Candidatus Aminicenantes bacterium]|jgi:predicted membrane protein|nr:cell wall-active antibiotics response protein [Candidatus Aminicenantes bacterium]